MKQIQYFFAAFLLCAATTPPAVAGNYHQLANSLRLYGIAPHQVNWTRVNQQCRLFRQTDIQYRQCQLETSLRNAHRRNELRRCKAEAKLSYPNGLHRQVDTRLYTDKRRGRHGVSQIRLSRGGFNRLQKNYVTQCVAQSENLLNPVRLLPHPSLLTASHR